MEIAARQNFVRLCKDERIVGHGVGLDEQRGRDLRDKVEAGTHDLRLATQRVGILYSLARSMRFADFASGEQGSVDAGDALLTVVATQFVNARIKGHIAALERIERHRAGHDGRGKHPLQLKQCRQRKRRRNLSPVDQREAFLGAQLERRDSFLRQCLGGGPDLAVAPDRAEPEDRQ